MQISCMTCRVARCQWRTRTGRRHCGIWTWSSSRRCWRGNSWRVQGPTRVLGKRWIVAWWTLTQRRPRTGSMSKPGGLTSSSWRHHLGPHPSGERIFNNWSRLDSFARWLAFGNPAQSWIGPMPLGSTSRRNTWLQSFGNRPILASFWQRFPSANWTCMWQHQFQTSHFPWKPKDWSQDLLKPRWLFSTTWSTCVMARSGYMLAGGPNLVQATPANLGRCAGIGTPHTPQRSRIQLRGVPHVHGWGAWGPQASGIAPLLHLPEGQLLCLWTCACGWRCRDLLGEGSPDMDLAYPAKDLWPSILHETALVCLGEPPHCREETQPRTTWWWSARSSRSHCWKEEDPEGDHGFPGTDAVAKANLGGGVAFDLAGSWDTAGSQALH